MSTATQIFLGIGDGETGDYIDLTQYDRAGTFTVALPEVALELDLTGTDISTVQRIINDINRYLSLAAESSRPHGHGERVTLSFRLLNGTWAYCDVLGGLLLVPAETMTGAHLTEDAPWLSGVSLGMMCLPLGRLDPIERAASSTFTHGSTSAVYVVGNIPGDAPALCELSVADVSTGSAVINWLRVAIRSGRQIEASDFAFVRDAVNGADGTEAAEAGTIGGNRSRVTTDAEWQEVATVEIEERGLVEVIARVRDSSAGSNGVLEWLGSTPRTGTTGSLADGTYRVVAAALNGGNIIAVSEPRTITISGISADSITAVVSVPSAADDFRFYIKKDTDAYVYFLAGSATGVYTYTTLAGATTGNPPTSVSDAVQPTLVRSVIGLSSGVNAWAQPQTSPQIGDSAWEHLTIFRGILPPSNRSEHRADLTTLLAVQAKQATADSTPTLDVDAFIVLPLDGQGMTVEYPGLDLATKRTWRLETNRYGEPIAYLVDGSGNEAGPLDVLGGSLTLAHYPNVNLIYVMPEVAGGESDVTDAKYTVSARITPRWRTLGAAVP